MTSSVPATTIRIDPEVKRAVSYTHLTLPTSAYV